MTPLEKAKDLFDKMNGFRVTHAHRIKCAKICVDQIMYHVGWNDIPKEDKDNYWPDVKKELDKLKKK